MKAKRVTLRDVAHRVGLSMGATSRALIHNPNCTSRVSEATRQRVQRIAAEMGYRHNRAAQSLRTGRTGILAIVVPSAVDSMSVRRMRAAVAATWEAGMSPMVYHSDLTRPEQVDQIIDAVLGSGADGVILCGSNLTKKHTQMLMERSVPVVFAGGSDLSEVKGFYPDKRDGFFQLGRHLVEEGYRSIGLLTISLKTDGAMNKGNTQAAVGALRDVEQWAAGRGIALETRTFCIKSNLLHTGVEVEGTMHPLYSLSYLAMRELIGAGKLPAALMCQNDSWAAAAMLACAEEGIRVPQDIAITGFDNDSFSCVASVPLTTIDNPVEEIFRRAVEELVRWIQSGVPPKVEQHPVPCRLIVRRSSTQREIGRPMAVRRGSVLDELE